MAIRILRHHRGEFVDCRASRLYLGDREAVSQRRCSGPGYQASESAVRWNVPEHPQKNVANRGR
jgi:hypothetical protein